MDSLIMERSYDMNRDRKTLVSIVVPCFNEEEVLPIYIHAMEKIIKEMKTAEVEIILWMMAPRTGRRRSSASSIKRGTAIVTCRFRGILGKRRLCMQGCRRPEESMWP